MNKKRVGTATILGVITAVYCSGSLWLIPPPGVHPQIWFVIMIFYGRVLQGFTIGLNENIPLHPLLRGAVFGLIFSGFLAIVPLSGGNMIPAIILIIYGIIYGIITDLVSTWAAKNDK